MGRIFNFKSYKEKIALHDDLGNTLSYEELFFESSVLVDKIGHRCLVFILCRNEIGSILGYVSCVDNGIVPVLLNSSLDDNLLNNLLDSYCPEYLWVPEEQYRRFHDYAIIYKLHNYVLLKTCYSKTYPLYEDLCLLMTTSGSTGSPKLVRLSYLNLISNTESIVDFLKIDATEKTITTLPMNYVYGLSIINTHLFVGAKILVTEKGITQKEFWNFFKHEEATNFGGVPYTYEILDRLRFTRMNVPSLRSFTQAGGKLSPELQLKFAKYAVDNNKSFIVMYGAAEATARMGYLPPDKTEGKKGSIGIAIPGGKFYLIDSQGNTITDPNVEGELVYEGKNVSLGYSINGDDLLKRDEHNFTLQTGDVAFFDEDGFFYIVGRNKRFLKIFGNRVNLDEIERLIFNEFKTEVACSGVDDHIYIFITDEQNNEKIKNFVSEVTNLNPIAFNVLVIDEIPRNESGKVLYNKLSIYYA